MSREKKDESCEAIPEAQRIFRYWVELRDLRGESMRNLPLIAITKIHLRTKKNASELPNEQLLQLKDGSTMLEGTSLEEIATQLRQRYPDNAFERTLHRERDLEAERRRKSAMDALIRLVARAALAKLTHDGG